MDKLQHFAIWLLTKQLSDNMLERETLEHLLVLMAPIFLPLRHSSRMLGQKGRLVLNEVKPNVYREICLSICLRLGHIIVYPALAGAITLACWASLRSAPTYKSCYLNPAVAGVNQLITLGDNAPSDFTCKNADPRVGSFNKCGVGRTTWAMVARYKWKSWTPIFLAAA